MNPRSLLLFLLIPFAHDALASADAATPTANKAEVFECKDDALKVELTLRGSPADATSSPIESLSTNGRPIDPATFRFIDSLATGRVVERTTSSCKDKSLELVLHLAPMPGEKRDSITVTAWKTTVKVH